MYPLNANTTDLLNELYSFNQKLATGINTLQEVGEGDTEIGISPKEAVYHEDKLTLYRYKSRTDKQNKTPILIVYALVNRPYMIDFKDKRSMVQGLLDSGLDVYLIDWGYPDIADRYLTLTDYINGYLDRCVDVVCKQHGLDRINLLGICQGGTFSCCYSALHPEKVNNLILTVTPVDFHTKNDLLSHMVRFVDIDLLVNTLGNISGELLNSTFLSLKPYRLNGQKYMDFINILDDPKQVSDFMRLEKWIFDSPDQAGEAYREFIKEFYQANKLIQGTLHIDGQPVLLSDLTMPILNIFAAQDHLVPPESSRALVDYVGTDDYTALEFPGGHIGIYVSAKAQTMIPPSVSNWLSTRG